MAVIGHWLVSFLLGHFVPEANITLLCKLSMLSDAVAGIFVVIGLERAGIYAEWFMSTPPPGTMRLVTEWKDKGLWEPGVDLTPGENGFSGFGALFPFYIDVSYSHSVELMFIFSVLLALYMLLRHRISAIYAATLILATISHPLLDIIFHDAHIFMGARNKSRYSLGLWQHDKLIIPALLLELCMAILPYKLWISTREPIDASADTLKNISEYKKMFWMMALTHNQASWYLVSPALQLGFYRFTSFPFGADNELSYLLVCVTLLSWTGALYPLHKLDCLLRRKDSKTDLFQPLV